MDSTLPPGNGETVLVAMSGGVDSSVAAALLQDAGYHVVGCFMRLGSDDSVEAAEGEADDPLACDPTKVKPGHQGCCSLNDASDARMVAALLDVPFYVLNFKRDFGQIMDYFVGEYNAGRTPNPCVRCNDWLKFGKLMVYADGIGARYVATGHYARIDHRSEPPRLLRGLDPNKDQSYVLAGTRRERLAKMLLPIGGYDKPTIRRIAEQRNLPVFDKPDSQEICFVPDNDYARLVKRRSPDAVAPGEILDDAGQVVGQHPGHQHFTIGQRRGVGVAFGYPIYVVDKDPEANTITVGTQERLHSSGLVADQVNWLIDPPEVDPDAAGLTVQVKIRHNSAAVPGHLIRRDADRFEIRFDQPQRAVTPGQVVACYDGDQLVAGGWIEHALDPQPVEACS